MNAPGAVAFFLLFLVISLAVTYWSARRTRTADDFYTAGRRIGAGQNGFALAGDFISAAGFLGLAGLIALAGFDGVLYAVGAVVAWPVSMFLFAEPLRNLGRYTVADVLAHRLKARSVRVVSAIGTLVIIFMYQIMQMVGAGTLVHLIFGLSYETAVIVTGLAMTIYVLFGGMIATTWLQIIKACLMLSAAVLLAGLVLARFEFNPIAVFDAAATQVGDAVLAPQTSAGGPLESISLALALILGISSLPHVLMRFFTVTDARAARQSLLYATGLIGSFHLLLLVIGFGAMVLLGPAVIRAADRGGNLAVPLLSELLGGGAFLGFVSAIAFVTILAVVAGLVITGAATLSHDLWSKTLRNDQASAREQMIVARVATVVLCVIGLLLGLLFKGQNIVFMAGLATAVAASTNFPVLTLAVFWPRLTTAGATCGMISGLTSTLLLIYLSPLVQVDLLHRAAPLIELRNPGIISIPLAFAVTIAVSLLTRPKPQSEHDLNFTRQALIGPGND